MVFDVSIYSWNTTMIMKHREHSFSRTKVTHWATFWNQSYADSEYQMHIARIARTADDCNDNGNQYIHACDLISYFQCRRELLRLHRTTSSRHKDAFTNTSIERCTSGGCTASGACRFGKSLRSHNHNIWRSLSRARRVQVEAHECGRVDRSRKYEIKI